MSSAGSAEASPEPKKPKLEPSGDNLVCRKWLGGSSKEDQDACSFKIMQFNTLADGMSVCKPH